MKRIKHVLIMLIAAVFAVILVPALAGRVSAEEEIKPVEWQLTKDDTGVVTRAGSKWNATSGADYYTMFLYKKGVNGSIASAKPTTASYDFSEKILEEGSGSYYVEGYAVKGTVNFLAHYKSETIDLCKLTIDTQGYGEDIELENVEGSTQLLTILENSYLKPLGSPNVYYTQNHKKALVGFAKKPLSQMPTRDDLFSNLYYVIGDGPTYTANWGIANALSFNLVDQSNPRLYAIWFDVIRDVRVGIEPPDCSEETTTVKKDGDWDWNSQTNRPRISVPDGCGYHLADEPYAWWEEMDDEDTPYIGRLTGDQDYKFNVQLVADYGYVFPGDNDGVAIAGAVDKGQYLDVYNSDASYGYWLYNDDEGLYAVPLWLTGTVHVAHDWDNGAVTREPTEDQDGVITFTCGVCGDTKTEAFKQIDLSGAQISGVSDRIYTGKAHTQNPVVKVETGGVLRTLQEGTDYTLSYENNIKAGNGAVMTVTGIGIYTGSVPVTFVIAKAANPLKIKAKTATVKYSAVRKKNQTLAAAKVIAVVKKGQGAMSYKITGVTKAKFKKYFKINAKTGKITVKKGLKKGTYKVKIQVRAAGNGNYQASAAKTVTSSVKVK